MTQELSPLGWIIAITICLALLPIIYRIAIYALGLLFAILIGIPCAIWAIFLWGYDKIRSRG